MGTKFALLPISVDNPRFTTEFLLRVAAPVLKKYPNGIFLVADELQLYNKTSSAQTPEDLSILFSKFSASGHVHQERHAWLENIRNKLSEAVDVSGWRVCAVSDFTDASFYRIYRNIVIAYHTVPAFRDAVQEDAQAWIARRQRPMAASSEALSVLYLLEEAALNIRLHFLESVTDEFYAFNYPTFFEKLYKHSLGIYPHMIAGLTNDPSISRFWHWNVGERRWDIDFVAGISQNGQGSAKPFSSEAPVA